VKTELAEATQRYDFDRIVHRFLIGQTNPTLDTSRVESIGQSGCWERLEVEGGLGLATKPAERLSARGRPSRRFLPHEQAKL